MNPWILGYLVPCAATFGGLFVCFRREGMSMGLNVVCALMLASIWPLVWTALTILTKPRGDVFEEGR